MAINTAAKRASVQAYTLGLMRPPPDGTVGAADRPVLAWLYARLSYAAAAISTAINPLICSVGRMMSRR